MTEWLSVDVFGHTVSEWMWVVAYAAAILVALLAARMVAVRRLAALARRTSNRIDDLVVEVFRGLRPAFLVVVAVYIAQLVRGIDLPPANRIMLLLIFVQVGLLGNHLMRVAGRWYIEMDEEDKSRLTLVRAAQLTGRIVLWSILLVLVLDNFGVDITALITGLGIGGIAIALAVQNVLKDLLAYVSILVDRPFVYGDFLVVGDLMGTVEDIGIKTTRLRSLSGEQLIFTNTDLLESRIRNYKRMFERRIVFSVGVEYDTPAEVLETIPGILKDAIEAQEDVRFDRAHLKAFDDSSIGFEVVYFVTQPDYAVYMDRQQAINLSIFRRFNTDGIAFAFPTQTLHVASLPAD